MLPGSLPSLLKGAQPTARWLMAMVAVPSGRSGGSPLTGGGIDTKPFALPAFLDRMRYCLRVDDKVEFRLADSATITGLSKQARACTKYFYLVGIFRIGHDS